jgi:hypothetical protein
MWENDHYTVEKQKASKLPLLPVASWKGLGGLHLNQDGIKRGGVA